LNLDEQVRAIVKDELIKTAEPVAIHDESKNVPTPAELRFTKGYTREHLAICVGSSEPTIRRLELGRTKHPDLDLCNKIALQLGIDAELYRSSVYKNIKKS